MITAKKIIGWICLLCGVMAPFFALYGGYYIATPFLRGGEIYSYNPPPSVYSQNSTYELEQLAEKLVVHGLGDSSDAELMAGYALGEGRATISSGWGAAFEYAESLIPGEGGWLGNAYIERVSQPHTNVVVMALVDNAGNWIASYPASLIHRTRHIQTSMSHTWVSAFKIIADENGSHIITPYRIYNPHDNTRQIGTLAVAWHNYHRYAVIPSGVIGDPMISPGASVLIVLITLILFILLLPLWTGMDASSRGMRGFAWWALVALTGLLGFAAYLIARLAPKRKCPNCGEDVLAKFKRCPSCGMTLPTKCPICGRKLKPGWLHCPMCVEEQPKETPVSEPIEPEPVHVRLNTDPALPEVSDYTILRIRTIDADAFTSISNAEITIQGPTSLDGITNTEGLFEARSLESGAYTVSASAPGYEYAQEVVQIDGEANLSLDITLKARTGTITGRVLDRTTLQPVSQAHVFIDSARIDRSTATNTDGAFELDDIPPGPYTTCADSTGYTPQTRLAEIEPGGHVALSFALEAAQEDNEDAAN